MAFTGSCDDKKLGKDEIDGLRARLAVYPCENVGLDEKLGSEWAKMVSCGIRGDLGVKSTKLGFIWRVHLGQLWPVSVGLELQLCQ
jgi:hypothetical protein